MLQEMHQSDDVRVTRSSFFVVRRAGAESAPTRFAVIVSAKIAKTAVERNRIKRRVHGVLEDLLPRIADGSRVALYAKAAVRDTAHAAIRDDLETALSNTGVLHT